MNDLSLQIFSSGTTRISDVDVELNNVVSLWYETGYPGGKYLAGGCYIPRVPQDWWEIDGPLRVVVRSGQAVVYEGVIPSFQHQMGASDMGVMLNFTGFWGWSLLNRMGRKRWADDRVDEQTWLWRSAQNGADKCTIQRDSRLYFLPKSESWADDDKVELSYVIPNSTIKRITFDYDLTGAAGEDWTAFLWDVDNASSEWSVNIAGDTDATGSVDIDSTSDFTATTNFFLVLQNTQGGAITPTSDGSTYLKITNMMVYSENEGATGINLDSVATDLVNGAYLNTDTNYLNASDNVRKVEPFITANDNYEPLGEILMRIAAFGNSNDDRYAVGVLASEMAATPDGLPVLFTEEYPDTSAGYDYFISLDDDNIVSNVRITRDYESVINNVIVTYRDEQGWQQVVTSDDSDAAGLADSDSQDDYGRRDESLSVGNSTKANAIDYGTRFIQRYKDPQWFVNGSIGVMWAIEGDSGELIPASRVEAGKRLKIDGYDTFIVSRTRYDADSETVELTVGNPFTSVFNETVFAPTWDDPVPTGGGTGYSGGGSGGGGADNAQLVGMRHLKKTNKAEWLKRKKELLSWGREHGRGKGWRKKWLKQSGY